MPTVHLLIKGKVQGVFYRANTKKKADEYYITGWVQNTPDDAVEIIASGSQNNLDQFINWCKQGPSRAKVTDVIREDREEETFADFSIKR